MHFRRRDVRCFSAYEGAPRWTLAPPPERRPERPPVAVGMPVARHPPHRSVLALLTHTVLTSDGSTQSERQDTGAEPRLPVAGSRVSPKRLSTSSGFFDSAGEAATTTCAALRAGTPSVAPRCEVQHDIGNIREPPIAATPSCP